MEQVKGRRTSERPDRQALRVQHQDQPNRQITWPVALRGSSKAQGAWGELILERILQAAGLRSGHEYDAQESYAAENGPRAQPDVVIHLPGDRHLIIDSKVSLVHYEAHSTAESEAARSLAADSHSSSVRAHIRGLAEKNYQTLYGLNSLDFVIMFLPYRAGLHAGYFPG